MIERLVSVCDQFAEAARYNRTTLSRLIFGSGPKLDDLAEGRVSVTIRCYERAVQWLIDNWPPGAPVPADLARIEAALALEIDGAGNGEG